MVIKLFELLVILSEWLQWTIIKEIVKKKDYKMGKNFKYIDQIMPYINKS